jgi:hypothetical protein
VISWSTATHVLSRRHEGAVLLVQLHLTRPIVPWAYTIALAWHQSFTAAIVRQGDNIGGKSDEQMDLQN